MSPSAQDKVGTRQALWYSSVLHVSPERLYLWPDWVLEGYLAMAIELKLLLPCLRQEEHMLWQKSCRRHLLSLYSFMNIISTSIPVTLPRQTFSSLKLIVPLSIFFLNHPVAYFSVLKAQQKISVERANKLLIYTPMFSNLSSSYLDNHTMLTVYQ